jgi:hypothetical protein
MISSFFIPGILCRARGRLERPGALPQGRQTVSKSRAPVSEEGWRNLDIARASI